MKTNFTTNEKLAIQKAQTVCDHPKYKTQIRALKYNFEDHKQNRHRLIIFLLQKIENNDTILCNYKLFHIPFLYIISEAAHRSTETEDTYILCLMKSEIKRLAFLNKQQSAQFSSNFVYGVIGDSLRFKQMPENYFLNKLKEFLNTFKIKMSTIMPYYYEMFDFICSSSQDMNKSMSYRQIKQIFDDKHHQLHIKYHNRDLQ